MEILKELLKFSQVREALGILINNELDKNGIKIMHNINFQYLGGAKALSSRRTTVIKSTINDILKICENLENPEKIIKLIEPLKNKYNTG